MERAKLFTYACDDVRYKRKENDEAWIPLEKANGSMFHSYPFFSFPPGSKGSEEPVRYGDFVIDIDTHELACGSAIKIVEWFGQVYGVEPEQWRVYLSGKKGVHLELPAEILGTDDGHQMLPLAYKRLAKDIEGELNLKLDTSMYNRGTGKPYRQPNVMRDCGTCKRQIDFSDLFEILSEDDYRAMCSEPGATWQPDDISQNSMLADKMHEYIEESVKHYEAVKNARPLSDDEVDRLAISKPPCISFLANLTDTLGTSATFNDVAIQITAYAITSQLPEQEFLSAFKSFIENYPSVSLNTIQKRYDNCIARYRTMAANGNQHSCGGIKALRFPGYDCKQCKAMPDGPPLSVEVMSKEDVEAGNLTLHIPEDILRPGGLITAGVEALEQPGMPNIPQYYLPTILTTIGNAVAGKLVFGDVWPNLYNIKVGPTSTGKTSVDNAISSALKAEGVTDFYGITDFASGPALMRAMMEKPQTMMVIDEATSLFRRYSQMDSNSDGKRDALLELFSKSGQDIKKVYSDAKNIIEIDKPCLSLTGNATPVIFDAIREEDFNTGTMQRFDFWCYDGAIPHRNGIAGQAKNQKAAEFALGIKAIREANLTEGNLSGHIIAPRMMQATDDCVRLLSDLSYNVIEQSNATENEGERGILSRQYNLAIKYAIIHAAATRPIHGLSDPLDASDIRYGIKVASMLADWKINVLKDKVTTGDFHKNCEIFKKAIAAVMKMGQRPTFKTMANRRRELKNWKRKDSEEIIAILEKRGEIVLDDSKRTTAYYLAK